MQVLKLWAICLLFIVEIVSANAQQPSWSRHVAILCDSFAGRGYTFDGVNRAAQYLSNEYKNIGLQPLQGSDYLLPYTMPVNTFPGKMDLTIDGKKLKPGIDFLVDPASTGIHTTSTITTVDLKNNPKAINKKLRTALFVKEAGDVFKGRRNNIAAITSNAKRKLYLLPRREKPLWWVATDTLNATVIYLYDTAIINQELHKINADIESRFEPKFKTANIAGYIKGTQNPDSFLVISAHYDHLGTMGDAAIFLGASDNASGVAMLLQLASYFKEHPPKYSVAFLLFSGEEAGLLGSSHYVANPVFPLANIKLLVNLDIMGDASEGITVVNGSVHKALFEQIKLYNEEISKPLPQIVARGAAANSDHYPFSEAGVPAIFIYSNGGKGFYHDTWDRPETLSYNNIDAVYELLQELGRKIR